MAPDSLPFARRVIIATAIPLAAVLIILLIVRTAPILLLFFVGALFGLFLRAGADLIAAYTRLPRRVSLALFGFGLAGLLTLFGFMLAPSVGPQLEQLGEQLPEALERVEAQVRALPWARDLLEDVSRTIEATVEREPGLLLELRRVFSVTVGALVGVVVLFAVGVYLAADPAPYTRSFILLFPPQRRARMAQVLARLAHVLRMWLLGRAIGMAFVGVLTALGLLWLGVPLALALGLIAGLLDFIPNIGPLLAAIPAILIALTESPRLAVYVVALYAAVQTLEAYLIEPMIEQKVVRVAPAFNIITQILMATLLGFLGLLLATPLLVTLMVLVRELYVKDVLEQRGEASGSP